MVRHLPLVVFAAFVATLHSQDHQPVFRTSSSVVPLLVSVRNNDGPVLGLQAADFEVFDQGVRQSDLQVNASQFPLSIKVVVDVSSSIRTEQLTVVDQALGTAASSLGPADAFQSFAFIEQIERRHNSLRASATLSQGSSIIDAAIFSLISAPDLVHRTAVFFVTDGHDTSSKLEGSVLEQTARRSSAQFNLLVMAPGSCRGVASALASLRRAAEDTGGTCEQVGGAEALGETLRKGLQVLKEGYLLAFSPTSTQPGWHPILVKVRPKRAEVRARMGYWQ